MGGARLRPRLILRQYASDPPVGIDQVAERRLRQPREDLAFELPRRSVRGTACQGGVSATACSASHHIGCGTTSPFLTRRQ
jgi:hypothetical protein